MYSSDDDTIEISISVADRDLLQDVPDLPQDILERFAFAVPEGDDITVALDPNDLDELLFCLGDYADALKDKKLRQRARRLYEHIGAQEPDYAGDEEGDLDGQEVASLILFANLPDAIRADLDATVEAQAEEDMGAALALVMERHGATPQPTLAGLNFMQFMALLLEEWGEPTCPLQLNDSLGAEDLKHATLLHNARTLLDAVGAGVALDEDNYLPEDFVAAIVPKLSYGEGASADEYLALPELVEEDVDELVAPHFVCESAELLVPVAGQLTVSAEGEALRAPEAVGALYCTLFTAHFRSLALECLDPLGDWPSLQIGVPYALYQLSRESDEWRTIEPGNLPYLLPAAHIDLPEDTDLEAAELAYELFVNRVLVTLCNFGLIELDNGVAPTDDTTFRKTPLFDKFIRFQLP